jgi:hypothetical protein
MWVTDKMTPEYSGQRFIGMKIETWTSIIFYSMAGPGFFLVVLYMSFKGYILDLKGEKDA